MGKIDTMTLLDFYNMLLEAERAGVTVLSEINIQVMVITFAPLLGLSHMKPLGRCRLTKSRPS